MGIASMPRKYVMSVGSLSENLVDKTEMNSMTRVVLLPVTMISST